MTGLDKDGVIKNSTGRHARHCTGYSGSGGYVTVAVMGIGSFTDPCGHTGLKLLDSVKAFDLAETVEAYIGQINMVQVTSFCGPEGLVWGHDLARPEDAGGLTQVLPADTLAEFAGVTVRPGSALRRASRSLLGTQDKRRFSILPGSHVPCAARHLTVRGPARLYAAFAVAVPEDRHRFACLLLEDVGILDEEGMNNGLHVQTDMLRASAAIGKNHGTRYTEVYVDYTESYIAEGEVGCALVAMPYLQLASDAWVPGMSTMSLEQWEKAAGLV